MIRTEAPPEIRMFTPDTCCTLVPYFEIRDGQLGAFKALAQQLVAKTRSEPGCMHYAFSFDGHLAHCREGYVDADALLAHRENVAELLGQALRISTIVRFEVHAPASEIDKLRGPMTARSPQFFTLEPGFRRSTSSEN